MRAREASPSRTLSMAMNLIWILLSLILGAGLGFAGAMGYSEAHPLLTATLTGALAAGLGLAIAWLWARLDLLQIRNEEPVSEGAFPPLGLAVALLLERQRRTESELKEEHAAQRLAEDSEFDL